MPVMNLSINFQNFELKALMVVKSGITEDLTNSPTTAFVLTFLPF